MKPNGKEPSDWIRTEAVRIKRLQPSLEGDFCELQAVINYLDLNALQDTRDTQEKECNQSGCYMIGSLGMQHMEGCPSHPTPEPSECKGCEDGVDHECPAPEKEEKCCSVCDDEGQCSKAGQHGCHKGYVYRGQEPKKEKECTSSTCPTGGRYSHTPEPSEKERIGKEFWGWFYQETPYEEVEAAIERITGVKDTKPAPEPICTNENCDGEGLEKTSGGHIHKPATEPSDECMRCHFLEKQIDKLANYMMKEYPEEITDGGAVEVAIKVLKKLNQAPEKEEKECSCGCETCLTACKGRLCH